jgi:hypothetical protein
MATFRDWPIKLFSAVQRYVRLRANVLQKSPVEQPIINIGQELNPKERIF